MTWPMPLARSPRLSMPCRMGARQTAVGIPFWVMLIGAVGLSVGLLLFGPKLINIVGSEITRLNAMRAYCVALAAAITVIFASWLGLPVSSTHIANRSGFRGRLFPRVVSRARAEGSAGVDLTSPPELRTRKKVVRRGHFVTILAAWVVTVPLACRHCPASSVSTQFAIHNAVISASDIAH